MTISDSTVRLQVYRAIVETGRVPSIRETADALSVATGIVEDAFQRLAAARILVLRRDSPEILMAMPFSAVPTPFRAVAAGGRSWWSNCAFDAFGIPAILGEDVVLSTSCQDCREPIEIPLSRTVVPKEEGVCHILLPPSRWWEDIVFT